MCGRYTLTTRREDLARELRIPLEDVLELEPRYNIAPTQRVPIVLQDRRVRMALFQWGLVPQWAKDPSIGNRMINARRESVADKPAFAESFRSRRCLVVADGFYEWQTPEGGGRRIPHYIRLGSGKPFTFAGLWASWRDRAGEELLTCTIITVDSNDPHNIVVDIYYPAFTVIDSREIPLTGALVTMAKWSNGRIMGSQLTDNSQTFRLQQSLCSFFDFIFKFPGMALNAPMRQFQPAMGVPLIFSRSQIELRADNGNDDC